jgi:CubicO group peptidase (beta-lactamase class C family)
MLEQYIRQQIEKKTFPGISLLAAGGGKILYDRHFGLKAVWPEPQPLAADTLYDLASLTKPLVSAFLAVYLIEKKQWRLDDEVRRFFPAFTSPVTLEQLLTHSAGFQPWHPFYLYHPQDDLTQISALNRIARPGAMVLYSDIGYILLRRLLEKVSGSGFQELAQTVIFDRLKLRDTFFLVPKEKKPYCAPTEIGNGFERNMCAAEHEGAAACFFWRSELIRGDVHDANSYYSGGSAGNAGLFSCSRDLFKMGLEFFPESATLLKSESIALFWQNRTPGDRQQRSIGFLLNRSPQSSGGRALAPGAIGHNGFTGTSLWLEAEKQRQWILLTNRVHPRVETMNFNGRRRKLHRLLKLELNLA